VTQRDSGVTCHGLSRLGTANEGQNVPLALHGGPAPSARRCKNRRRCPKLKKQACRHVRTPIRSSVSVKFWVGSIAFLQHLIGSNTNGLGNQIERFGSRPKARNRMKKNGRPTELETERLRSSVSGAG
jgi:hypothetical protein